MTTNDIDAIRKLTDAATPGPWKTGDRFGNRSLGSSVAVLAGNLPPVQLDPHRNGRNDAEFIAAARTHVPNLCDEIEQLRAELAKVPPAWATFTADDMHGAGLETVAAEMECDALTAELAKTNADLTQSRHLSATYANEIGALKAELEQTRAEDSNEQRCPNCAPGYDCERGIYTPEAEPGPDDDPTCRYAVTNGQIVRKKWAR